MDAFTRKINEPRTNQTHTPYFKFTGHVAEDPKEYLRLLGNYVIKNNIEDRNIENVVRSTLRGAAYNWYRQNRVPGTWNWKVFRQQFEYRFDSVSFRVGIWKQLYGEIQGPHQAASPFMCHKVALLQRLAPHMTETEMVAVIVELLSPRMRMCARGKMFKDTNELIDVMIAIEKDLAEMDQKRRPPPAYPPRYRSIPTRTIYNRSQREEQKRPSPCRNCDDNHFHRDCPRRIRGSGNTKGGPSSGGART